MKAVLVGVSWRESVCEVITKQVLRSMLRVADFDSDSAAKYRKFYSTESNMPSSDTTDCVGANSSQSVELRFAKLTENAVTPTRGSRLAAGFDLHRLIHACVCNIICHMLVTINQYSFNRACESYLTYSEYPNPNRYRIRCPDPIARI